MPKAENVSVGDPELTVVMVSVMDWREEARR